MRRALLIASNNAISACIKEQLLDQHDEVVEIQHSEELKPIKEDRPSFYNFSELTKFENWSNENSDLFEGSFDSYVFSLGKGGVRPIKLNKQEFVQDMFQQNVFAFIETLRVLVKKRLLKNKSSVVAISSVSGVKGLKSKVVYSASKSALEGAVRSSAAELGEKGIRVNAILKGWVTSDMNLDFIQSNMSIGDNEDFKKQFLGPIEPEDVADLVGFLVSNKSKSITGASILLDGGYSL